MRQIKKRYVTLAILLTVVLIGVFYVRSQRVFIPDPRLEDLIREESGKEEGQIYSWQLTRIHELDATDRGISDLRGIEYVKNLRWLNLEDNRIRDVAPLATLSRLNYLSLRNNGITCLDDIQFYLLTDLPLQGLSLRHNVVRYGDGSQTRLSDISILAYFQGLTFLELRDNHIADATPVAGLEDLVILDISHNPLEDTRGEFLAGLVDLEELNMRETGLESLDFLTAIPKLLYLNIHSNPDIESILPIATLLNLEMLIMRNVPVGEEIPALSELTRLQRLNVRNCKIQDLTVLGQLMAAGALQDRPADGVEADVDIEDNPLPVFSETGIDGYAPIRPYWDNIQGRNPEQLPL